MSYISSIRSPTANVKSDPRVAIAPEEAVAPPRLVGLWQK